MEFLNVMKSAAKGVFQTIIKPVYNISKHIVTKVFQVILKPAFKAAAKATFNIVFRLFEPFTHPQPAQADLALQQVMHPAAQSSPPRRQFMNLPAELRLQIWKEALDLPDMLLFSLRLYVFNFYVTRMRLYPVADLYHTMRRTTRVRLVCNEANAEVLRLLPAVVQTRGGPIRMNPARQAVCLHRLFVQETDCDNGGWPSPLEGLFPRGITDIYCSLDLRAELDRRRLPHPLRQRPVLARCLVHLMPAFTDARFLFVLNWHRDARPWRPSHLPGTRASGFRPGAVLVPGERAPEALPRATAQALMDNYVARLAAHTQGTLPAQPDAGAIQAWANGLAPRGVMGRYFD
ncbi:hypothetical protein NKR23_g4289 [Pleurostoma richardsiae]|uniref:2EXR domain-containing protein n=1 Tax=Pleurostoma richardsiae TaxID=41990 RepID=A0AA38RVZ9_9PEZI|nr:hypothetical protein NKR23_g4289 [Pleurostoma richardsiae]